MDGECNSKTVHRINIHRVKLRVCVRRFFQDAQQVAGVAKARALHGRYGGRVVRGHRRFVPASGRAGHNLLDLLRRASPRTTQYSGSDATGIVRHHLVGAG
jgi:hypothetical protein